MAYIRSCLCLAVILITRFAGLSQTDPVTSTLWYNDEKTAKIQIYKAADNRYYGKVVWLKVADKNGKPKMDENNPDKSMRTAPILGLVILKDLKRVGNNSFDDGKIYDPKNGKTYSCKMTYKNDKLDLRGYIGFSLIGRTTTWTKAD